MPKKKSAKYSPVSKVIASSMMLFLISAGLLAVMLLVKNVQDNRNQAWGGGRGIIDRSQLPSSRQGRLAGVDFKAMLDAAQPCDPKTFANSCQNDVMKYCISQGLLIEVKCSDYNASCGVVPSGNRRGESACIPVDLPTRPDKIISGLDKWVVGECNPDEFVTQCSEDVMAFCTRGGKLLNIDCAERATTCGIMPNGTQGCLSIAGQL